MRYSIGRQSSSKIQGGKLKFRHKGFYGKDNKARCLSLIWLCKRGKLNQKSKDKEGRETDTKKHAIKHSAIKVETSTSGTMGLCRRPDKV